MDPTRVKRSHQSKFVKQFCYYTIVVVLQIMLVLSKYFLVVHLKIIPQFDSEVSSIDEDWRDHPHD